MPDFFNYGVQSLYVGGSSPYDGASESTYSVSIEGVQSAGVALNYPRQDTFDWAGGGDYQIVQRPRTQLDFSYIFASQVNEANLGFSYSYSGYSVPALANMNQERNYYLVANLDHADQVGYQGARLRTIAIGNGLLSSYAFSSAVGQLSTVNVSVDALNTLIHTGSSGQLLPSVEKQPGSAATGRYTLPRSTLSLLDYYAATPKAIQLTFDTGCAIGVQLSGNTLPISSFGFTVNLPRAESKALGWAYPDSRPVSWPATVSIRADAYVTDYQEDALSRLVCSDSGFNFGVGFKTDCSGIDNFSYRFVGAKLDSQSFSASVGQLNRVSLNWTLKIPDINRAAPNFYIDSEESAFMSIVFPQVDYISGMSPLTFNLNLPSFLSIVSGNAVLNENQVVIVDPTGIVTVQVEASNGSDTQNLTVVVT